MNTLRANWDEYACDLRAQGIDAALIAQIRRSYYSGALVSFKLLVATEGAEIYAIGDELRAFNDLIQAGAA